MMNVALSFNNEMLINNLKYEHYAKFCDTARVKLNCLKTNET